MTDTLSIVDNRTGKKYDVPIQDGTIRAMDLRQIKTGPDDFGLMTYDPAFMNTANCRSAITYIDGDKGVLLYRGYPIEQLAEDSDFLETAYLILFGELPSTQQQQTWVRDITFHTMLHENIKKFMEGFRYDAHPMGIFLSTVGALSTLNPDAKQIFDPESRLRQTQAPDREGPEHRRLRLPPQHRPPVQRPRQRPQLHRQLPEHAVQDDRTEVSAQPGTGARAGRAVHPARRSRAELQHDDDADDRQLACGSVFGAGRRGGGAVRSAARRSQRGGAPHAARDRLGRRRFRSSSRRSKPGTTV